ncbi:MAG: type II toxin-antitoxin system RelE/ParE family toxin [Flavobacteriales bacterium]|jgi:toxin YoeB|nr:MAG: type II toxin-antitoxin system RelE/ParE family toxin [Flavobacteriales bacterium]
MVLRVTWSEPAQAQRRAILAYWRKRNGTVTYSKKLDARFRAVLRMIAQNPLLGRPSTYEGVRVKTIGDYLLFYRVQEGTILVASLWDNRQDRARLRIG